MTNFTSRQLLFKLKTGNIIDFLLSLCLTRAAALMLNTSRVSSHPHIVRFAHKVSKCKVKQLHPLNR